MAGVERVVPPLTLLCAHCLTRGETSLAVVVNGYSINNGVRRRLALDGVCAHHMSTHRGQFRHDSSYEGAWLRPLLWTYERVVVGSARYVELEIALGPRSRTMNPATAGTEAVW